MNCRDFEMNVPALARERLVDAKTRTESLTHAADCARCAARLEAARALIPHVRVVVAEIGDAEAPKRVEAALLTAFRQGASTARAARVPSRQRLALLAACLALISTLAIVWLWAGSPNRRRQAVSQPPAQINPEKPPAVAIKTESKVREQGPTPRQHNSALRRTFSRQAIPAEEVTEFFPLMDGVDPRSYEPAQIVRVEMLTSELMELGLPAGPEIRTGPINADLLLGYDGQVRAIRFVR